MAAINETKMAQQKFCSLNSPMKTWPGNALHDFVVPTPGQENLTMRNEYLWHNLFILGRLTDITACLMLSKMVACWASWFIVTYVTVRKNMEGTTTKAE